GHPPPPPAARRTRAVRTCPCRAAPSARPPLVPRAPGDRRGPPGPRNDGGALQPGPAYRPPPPPLSGLGHRRLGDGSADRRFRGSGAVDDPPGLLLGPIATRLTGGGGRVGDRVRPGVRPDRPRRPSHVAER